jgi:hypothetical protein
LESENAGRISGTVDAPGSAASIQRVIASISSERTGEALPGVRSKNSISSPPVSSPRTSAIRRRATSSPIPGGVRQSIRSCARAGITFILRDADTIVGVRVTSNIGSIISRTPGESAPIDDNEPATSPGSRPSPDSNAAGASVTV